MKASVIIPTYNKLPRLKLMMESMRRQDCNSDWFEVIIVDDGSTDGTKEYLEQYDYNFTCKVVHMSNAGRASARNRGVLESQGEILIFCDDDMILPPSYVSSHIEEQEDRNGVVIHGCIYSLSFLKFFSDPSSGMQYDNTVCTNKYLLKRCISQEDIRERFDLKFKKEKKKDKMESFVEETFQKENKEYHWVSLNGGNVSLPRTWLIEAGMFEEQFGKQWGGEDIELGYRLYKQQKPFIYSNRAFNYHMCHLRKNVDADLEDSFLKFYNIHKDECIMELYQQMKSKNESE